MLWPDGQVTVPVSTVKVFEGDVKVIAPPGPYDDAAQWGRFLRLLNAGIAGSVPPPLPRITSASSFTSTAAAAGA
jgi:hypothetical protein